MVVRKRRRYNDGEYQEQVALFKWAALQAQSQPELNLLNASLNGVRLSMRQAGRMKASGMKRGYPDIFLPVARGPFHGLFIELKVGKNKTSEYQDAWLEALTEQNYLAVVCWGWEAAMREIMGYLRGDGDDY